MSLTNQPENLLNLSERQINELRIEINQKYAQKSSNNDRRYENLDDKSIYYKFSNRNEFIRDRDRIIFSKAFRRLEHKAQVYSHEKGDHFRTRLTHTLEVMQIARSIGNNLGLNEDLIEAIALGHDIGHTPFGHSGEEVLDNIMRGEDDLGGKLRFKFYYGGFKHNFHSLRILDILERKYELNKGLNLTWQVLDGILKHTKVKKDGKDWVLNRFVLSTKILDPFMKESFINFPVTLEGQVVAIADEIAQRQHDLDDGLRDKDLNLRENKIIGYIQDTIVGSLGRVLESFDEIGVEEKSKQNRINEEIKLLKSLLKKIEKREEKKKFRKDRLLNKLDDIQKFSKQAKFSQDSINALKDIKDEINLLADKKKGKNYDHIWTSLVRDITEYFILDVTINSLKEIYKLEDEKNEIGYNRWVRHEMSKDGMLLNNKNIILKEIITFSSIAKEIDNKIENYINYSILNSNDVKRFDAKAYFIIRQIFKAYYSNPMQMSNELLDELSSRIKTNSDMYKCEIRQNVEFKNKTKIKAIHEIGFEDSPPKAINDLVNLLKLEMDYDECKEIFSITYEDEILDLEELLKERGYDIQQSRKKYQNYNETKYENWLFSKNFDIITQLKKTEILKESNIQKRNQLLFLKCLLEQHYAYISVICDHIAMMTDNYAKNEYKRLYLV